MIKIIKKAESTLDAREKLRKRFDLSEKQAQAILDLRLARLTKLEVYKLEEELKALKELIERLTAIVNSVRLQDDVVKKELLEIKKKYKTERRSKFVFSEDEASAERGDVRAPGVACIMGVTPDGKVKCVTEKNLHMSNKEIGEKSKPAAVLAKSTSMKSDSAVFIFTNEGNCYRTYAENCFRKYNENGCSLNELFEDAGKKERPVAVLSAADEGNVLFVTKKGMLKKTAWSEYAVPKPFFPAIRLNEGDELLAVEPDDTDESTTVFFVTRGGMCLNARKDDIPLQGRVAGGVKGMNLKEDDEVVFASQIDGEGEIIVAISGGRFKRVIAAQIDSLPRYRKGVQIASLKDESVIFADYVTIPYMLAIVKDDGLMTEISSEDIPIDSTNTRGRTLRGVKWTAQAVYAMKYRELAD